MAEEYQRVVDLPVKTASGISLLSDYLMGIDSNDGYQMLINDLAKRIVEDYVGSSLGGSSRTLKDALDAISNKIGSTTMGTTATTVTGAIKEHNDKIGSVAMGTTATTLTGAIKEHNDKIGNSTMGTTATTLTGAIAEHEDDIENINDLVGDTSMGTTATTITGAIAEHESDISTLNSKFVRKSVTGTLGPVSPGDIATYSLDISSSPSMLLLMCGFSIAANTELVPLQVYVSGPNSITVRVKNVSNNNISGSIVVYYF